MQCICFLLIQKYLVLLQSILNWVICLYSNAHVQTVKLLNFNKASVVLPNLVVTIVYL